MAEPFLNLRNIGLVRKRVCRRRDLSMNVIPCLGDSLTEFI